MIENIIDNVIKKPSQNKIMNPFLNDKQKIKGWLEERSINCYEISLNAGQLCVSANQNVDLTGMLGDSEQLEVRFESVAGSFNISNNKLKTLKGSPYYCSGSFNCSSNQLSNLIAGPLFVEDNYDCSKNLITSLEGAPSDIKGFDCSGNKLKDLKFLSPNMTLYFFATDNDLDDTMDFKTLFSGLQGSIDLSRNPKIEALGGLQFINKFKTILSIYKEQQKLGGMLEVKPNNPEIIAKNKLSQKI